MKLSVHKYVESDNHYLAKYSIGDEEFETEVNKDALRAFVDAECLHHWYDYPEKGDITVLDLTSYIANYTEDCLEEFLKTNYATSNTSVIG